MSGPLFARGRDARRGLFAARKRRSTRYPLADFESLERRLHLSEAYASAELFSGRTGTPFDSYSKHSNEAHGESSYSDTQTDPNNGKSHTSSLDGKASVSSSLSS